MPRIFERALDEILARVFECESAAGVVVPQPTSIAVAYSGGLDSSLLLYLAQSFGRAHNLAVHAFHIHHGLSENADAWEQHCRQQAEKWHTSFETCRIQIRRNRPAGLEQAARVARYRALGRLCRQHQIKLLLTAHHQDDQAETVLLQLLRGAGLPGLSAMPILQPECSLLGGGVALARPLLVLSRSVLLAFARRFELGWIEDESNTNVRYRRNAVRHQLLPLLTTEFPDCDAQLARSASHLQTAQGLLQQLARIDLAGCSWPARPGGQPSALDLSKLRQLASDRIDNLLRHWLAQHDLLLPSTARLHEIRQQLFAAAHDKHPCFDFGAWQLRRDGNCIALYPRALAAPLDQLVVRWHYQSAVDVPQWRGRLIFEQTSGAGLNATDLASKELVLRPRHGAERLKPELKRPSRTLKHLFQERLIPAWQRASLPLVYLDEQLVFAAGIGMDARQTGSRPGVVMRWQAYQHDAVQS